MNRSYITRSSTGARCVWPSKRSCYGVAGMGLWLVVMADCMADIGSKFHMIAQVPGLCSQSEQAGMVMQAWGCGW